MFIKPGKSEIIDQIIEIKKHISMIKSISI